MGRVKDDAVVGLWARVMHAKLNFAKLVTTTTISSHNNHGVTGELL